MTGNEGSQLLQSYSNAVSELADSVAPSVASVNTGRRGGSGIVWSREGLVVTANHVVGRSTAPTVTLADGRELTAEVVGTDPYTDVALLKIEAQGLWPMSGGGSEEVRVGQFILALASGAGKKSAATSGIVTSRKRSMRGFWGVIIEDAVVTDAKLNPGYSGGPLVDASGRLLGMNVAYFAGRGIAVSAEALKQTVSKISRDGKVKKGFLGVVVEPIELPDELAGSPQEGQAEGLLVKSVESGSPARAAGVAIGDIILRLGGARTSDEYELHRALSGDVVGKDLPLTVLRAERETELRVTPKEAE